MFVNRKKAVETRRLKNNGSYCSPKQQGQLRDHNTFSDEGSKAKSAITKTILHGNPHWTNPEKAIETRFEKNDGKFESEESSCQRIQTNNDRYGVDYFFQSSQFKALFNDPIFVSQSVRKRIDTKIKNGTLNTSKPELDSFHLLQIVFPNLKKQYKSAEYPFLCDFYDPDSSTYIELNAHWTHGKHFFNKDNPQDLDKLSKWQEKATTSKFYKNAIETWTVRDVKKLAVAKEKNLKYLVFWSIEEVRGYVDTNKQS